jgi:exosome complex RNA-binding protein Rrp4
MNNQRKKDRNSQVKINQPNKSNDSIVKLLLFPGEEYEFNEKLIHYDAFGFASTTGNLISKRCGVLLCDKNTNKILNDPNEEIYRSVGKYYSPKIEDFVIGTIVQKTSEFYKVDINTYTYAILNTKDFEGATKKTKPNLNLGDSVFARVIKTNKFDAPTLSCISTFEHKNWASGESFFGKLKDGNVFNIPKIYTWDLIKDNYAITRLQDVCEFEIVIAHNGKIWLNSKNEEHITKIYDIILKSLDSSKDETEKLIHRTFLSNTKVD